MVTKASFNLMQSVQRVEGYFYQFSLIKKTTQEVLSFFVRLKCKIVALQKKKEKSIDLHLERVQFQITSLVRQDIQVDRHFN